MSCLVQYIVMICVVIPVFDSSQLQSIFVSDACFNAKQYNESSIFSAPVNGIIDGIKLNHINGSFNCSSNAIPSFWGCTKESYQFTTMLMHITDLSNLYGDLYYPDIYTQGISIELANPEYNDSICEGGCYLEKTGYYDISGYNARNSINISFVNPSYNVTTTDLFMLQHSEACCNEFMVNDNSGSVCVSIYFLYSETSITSTDDKLDSLTLKKIIILSAVGGSIILCLVACIIIMRCNIETKVKEKGLQISLLNKGEKTYEVTKWNIYSEGQEKTRNVSKISDSDMLCNVNPEAMDEKGCTNGTIKRRDMADKYKKIVSVSSVDSDDALYEHMPTDGDTNKGTVTNTVGEESEEDDNEITPGHEDIIDHGINTQDFIGDIEKDDDM